MIIAMWARRRNTRTREKTYICAVGRHFRFAHYLHGLAQRCDNKDAEEGDRRVSPKFSDGGTQCPPRVLGPLPGCCSEGCCARTGLEPLRKMPSAAGVTTKGAPTCLSFGTRRRFRASSGQVATISPKNTSSGCAAVSPLSTRLFPADGSSAAFVCGGGRCPLWTGSIKSPKTGGVDTKRHWAAQSRCCERQPAARAYT